MTLNYNQINPVGTFTQTRIAHPGPLDLHKRGVAGFSALDPEEKKLAAFPVAFFDTREKPNPGSKDLAGKTFHRGWAASFQ